MSKHTIRNSYRTIVNPELRRNENGYFIAYTYRNDGASRPYSGRERLGAISRDEAKVAFDAWKTTQAQMKTANAVTVLDEVLAPYENLLLARAHKPEGALHRTRTLRAAIGHTPIGMLNRTLFNDFAVARGVKEQTLRGYVSTVNTAMTHAVEEGVIPENERRRFKLPKAGSRRLDHLDREEADEVYARAMGASIGQATLSPITRLVALAMDTGARRGAMADLTWDRINLKTGIIDFMNPKRPVMDNKRRVKIRIAKRLRPFLERAYRERAADNALFIGADKDTLSKWFGGWLAREFPGRRFEAFNLHALRHTFATLLIVDRGMKLATVASLLGDSIKMVSEVYGHLQPSDTDFDL